VGFDTIFYQSNNPEIILFPYYPKHVNFKGDQSQKGFASCQQANCCLEIHRSD
jgi:hypothetical protein